MNIMREYRIFRRRRSPRSENTFNNRSAIENGSITAVVTNSISCAGCNSLLPFTPNIRLCLRELGIVTQADYKSLVLVVFNKYPLPLYSFLTLKVPQFDPPDTDALPPRTSRLTRCLGFRRLLLPPLPLRLQPTSPPPSYPSQKYPHRRNSKSFLLSIHVPRLHRTNQLCQDCRPTMA